MFDKAGNGPALAALSASAGLGFGLVVATRRAEGFEDVVYVVVGSGLGRRWAISRWRTFGAVTTVA